MAQHKTRAFVLGTADYRETSTLLHVFCEDQGKLSLVARGLRSTRSRSPSAAGVYNLVQINYTLKPSSTIGALTSIDLERAYEGLRTDLDAYALANYWFEIISLAAQPGHAWPGLFQLSQEFLAAIDSPEWSLSIAVLHMAHLLSQLGIAPQLGACGQCGRTTDLAHFDAQEGCAICTSCAIPVEAYVPIPDDMYRGASSSASSFLVLVQTLLRQHLDIEPRSYDFARKTLATRRPGN